MSLPDRDPAVDVTLTPDAERITARVDGWMREVRDRAERGQLKYPPWHTATTPRNAGREGVEEALDLLWYLSAAEDQIAHLTARIADLERERCRMRGAGDKLAALMVEICEFPRRGEGNDYGAAIAWQEACDD